MDSSVGNILSVLNETSHVKKRIYNMLFKSVSLDKSLFMGKRSRIKER